MAAESLPRVDGLEGVRSYGEIQAIASFDVALADYDIEKPTGCLILSIADMGTIELHLLFQPT